MACGTDLDTIRRRLDTLETLPRAVFLLHRIDALEYGEIAWRLGIDSVVIQGGRVLDSVEATSMTANKRAQILKEQSVRNNGGTFIRDRATGQLIDISNVPTRIVRKS